MGKKVCYFLVNYFKETKLLCSTPLFVLGNTDFHGTFSGERENLAQISWLT